MLAYKKVWKNIIQEFRLTNCKQFFLLYTTELQTYFPKKFPVSLDNLIDICISFSLVIFGALYRVLHVKTCSCFLWFIVRCVLSNYLFMCFKLHFWSQFYSFPLHWNKHRITCLCNANQSSLTATEFYYGNFRC